MKIYAVKILDITEKKLHDLCLLISLKKKYKIEKFLNKEDKIRTLIGEMLIRTIIVSKLSILNKDIKFDINRYGKPYLQEYSTINFNISHSKDFVVCVIDDKPIGIDIEKVNQIEYKDIAKNFFTTSEYNYIIKKNLDIEINKFYEIWTLKESYIKCCGKGLSIPLKSFSININKNEEIKSEGIKTEGIKVICNDEYNKFVLKMFDTVLGYKIAVCSVNKEISNNIIMIDQNSLINNYSKFDLE